MVTVDQILAAEGEELSRLLGEVLQPENNKHNEDGYKANACITFCTKCKLEMNESGVPKPFPTMHFSRPCKFADPIPLNWDTAMKWRDWAVKEYGNFKLEGAIVKVNWPDVNLAEETAEGERVMTISALSFFAKRATPSHYLQAAAICKLNAEKGKQ